MGIAEAWENVREGESGPTLDLGLLFWEKERFVEKRRIQEPREDEESLLSATLSSKVCVLVTPSSQGLSG